MSTACTTEDVKAPLPWRRGVLWLLFLGPFFFLSYGYANHAAAARADVGSLFFAWETQIPFLPWTIVPYWSIDLLYGFSFLCCRNAREVDRHALRLLTAQLVAIACFLAFPLRFAFARPAADGLFGGLFTALAAFDLPYNQAPSLHIALLVLIWFQFSRLRSSPLRRLLIDGWALLIAVSVLTTWQHHFFDLPTGAALGLFCLWLWPQPACATPLQRAADAGHPRLAAAYLGGALLLTALAVGLGGLALLLGWPALALAIVGWNYAWAGAAGFQKGNGRHSLAVRWLLAPYMLAAWVNSRLWTHRRPQADLIADDVWLGRLPDRRQFAAGQFSALVDLCAELPAPGPAATHAGLDLVPLHPAALRAAAESIETERRRGPVLVACALGYSRSAAAVAAWLCRSGRAESVAEAVELIRRKRPTVVLDARWLASLSQLERPSAEQA